MSIQTTVRKIGCDVGYRNSAVGHTMNDRDYHESPILPPSLESWKDIDPFDRHSKPEWWMSWETLRPFFRSKGYILFKAGGPDGELSEPQPTENGYTFPAVESFGLHGDRIGFKSTFGRVSNCFGNNSHRYLKHFLQKSTVLEARDRSCIFPVFSLIMCSIIYCGSAATVMLS